MRSNGLKSVTAFLIHITLYLLAGTGLIILSSTASASDNQRGIKIRTELEKASGKTIGTYRALLIGINNYKDGEIPSLTTPVNDIKVLASILKRKYGFQEVELLLNESASSSQIIHQLRRLSTQSNKDDSILIYYAGHGDLDEITGGGWWIPYNATSQDPSTYIDNLVIQSYIKAIPARHVLLIADSCYSGSLFGESRELPRVFFDDKFYATLFKERSRWGMTSGNLTPVSDSGSEGHSIFAYQLLKTLRENQMPFITPREIYQKIGPIIRNNSEQMPITKPMLHAGDEGGEFIFISSALTEAGPQKDVSPLEESLVEGIGDIFIESEPSGAMVYLDGKQKKHTPLELNNVPAGRHTIELKKDQIYFAKLEIFLRPDSFVKRKVKLQLAKGKMRIASDPSGAKVYLNGKYTGKTTPDMVVTAAGNYELKLEKITGKGRLIHEEKITLEPGRRLALTITDFEEKIGFEGMVFIEGGCFEMGDHLGEGTSDERPVHNVCLDDFYLGEHEVTQKEWVETMGKNPSLFKKCGKDCPVESVSWNDAQEFIKKLNKDTEMNYRLPTEAEWEFAARERGRVVRFAIGKDILIPAEANFDGSQEYVQSYSKKGIFRKKTVPVKSFPPNALGLYEMTSNAAEWVADLYNKKYYSNSPRTNPKGPLVGSSHVLRGGSWKSEPKAVRVTKRSSDTPDYRSRYNGLRLAIGVDNRN